MNILVTGGAGYIGAVVVNRLKEAGHFVVVYDDLTKGRQERIADTPLVQGVTTDKEKLKEAFRQYAIEAVMHFAAWIEAGESMQNPGKYFYNNTFGSLQLLEAMAETEVRKLIFSSTAAVYGNPVRLPITETDPLLPVNPYGESKLAVEKMLAWYDRVYNLRSIAIRYFNAAGALPDGTLGEEHEPETHLIPNIIKSVLSNNPFKLFGQDYPTPDGTCVRDYIHVLDLASSHIVALEALAAGHASDVYNAGTGRGYSNKEVVAMVEKVSGRHVMVQYEPRREGDPEQLVADSSKLQQEYSWHPEYSDLETIITTAWKWHTSQI